MVKKTTISMAENESRQLKEFAERSGRTVSGTVRLALLALYGREGDGNGTTNDRGTTENMVEQSG